MLLKVTSTPQRRPTQQQQQQQEDQQGSDAGVTLKCLPMKNPPGRDNHGFDMSPFIKTSQAPLKVSPL